MNNLTKHILYGALTLMAMAFGYSALMLGHHIAFTLAKLDRVIDAGGVAMDSVNRPCGNGKPCGTLADVAKTLNTVRGTFGQIEIAANHENKNLATLDAQEAQLFKDLHMTTEGAATLESGLIYATSNVNRDLDTLNTTIAGVQPVLEGTRVTIGHADALVTDPAIKRFLESSADTGVQVDGTATDIRRVADKVSGQFLNPPPKHWWNYAGKVWSLAWQAGMLAK